jgi:metacaspase-1
MRIGGLLLGVLAAGALGAGALGAGALDARPRALLIGVGDVPNNALPAIDLDIDNMRKVATVMGFAPGDIKVLFNEQATYANVRQALSTWVRAGVGPDDRVLIYFSGHGTRVPDPSPGNVGGVDDALVLHDVRRARIDGRATLKNVLIGHEFGAALAAIPSHDVLVLVDACHSGTATRTLTLGNRRLGVGSGYMKFYAYPGMPTGTTRGLRALSSGEENYAALSAARDDEFAVGTEQGGLFTLGVVETIQSASREGKHPTVADLRAAATAYIAAHTDEQSRHHPVADGNERLIRGELALIPLRDGQGPTWQALAALAAQGEPLTLSGAGRSVHLGEQIVLGVTLPRAGFLNVVQVDSQDRATVLYPNKFATANEVKAGLFQFPTADMDFVLKASEPLGPALVVAFLTEKPVSLLQLGIEGRDAAGQMQQLFTEVSARATRALTVEARARQFAAGTLTVTVEGAAAP